MRARHHGAVAGRQVLETLYLQLQVVLFALRHAACDGGMSRLYGALAEQEDRICVLEKRKR